MTEKLETLANFCPLSYRIKDMKMEGQKDNKNNKLTNLFTNCVALLCQCKLAAAQSAHGPGGGLACARSTTAGQNK